MLCLFRCLMERNTRTGPLFLHHMLFLKAVALQLMAQVLVSHMPVLQSNIMSKKDIYEKKKKYVKLFRGNGISDAHNRFTHYACPVMKAIKTNSGSIGTISNMIPSLQHFYIQYRLCSEKLNICHKQHKLSKSDRPTHE